jgi:hypothetical protein
MLWLLASILLLAWIVLLAFFKVTAGHILLLAALALYIYGVYSAIRGRRGAHGTVP